MFFGMTGTVPHSWDGRANLFAAAFLIANGIGTGTLARTGQVLLSWTAASRNVGLVPWIVSFWADHPWVKLGLWLLGLALTLVHAVFGSRADQAELLARFNERVADRGDRRGPGGRSSPRRSTPGTSGSGSGCS